ncbi:MAG: ABC-type transport auxiliary lipoprotein family protein, partial [Planctomycetota bacterium]
MRLALPLLAWTAASCSSTAPSSRLYHFSTVPMPAAASLGAVSLAVGSLTPAGHLLEQRLAARVSDVEIEYYAGHRWAAPLSEILPEAILQGLSDAGIFREVVRGGESAGRADVILSGVVLAFEEEDRAEGWFGVARLDLALRAVRTDRIL